jgi:putative oxidoreductase
MVGLVFMVSGWSHLRDPDGRSKDIEMSKGFTIFLGLAELAGSLGVILGVLAQPAAISLILIMLGNSEEDFRLAHGFLGQIRHERLELRYDACCDEFSDPYHWRW